MLFLIGNHLLIYAKSSHLFDANIPLKAGEYNTTNTTQVISEINVIR